MSGAVHVCHVGPACVMLTSLPPPSSPFVFQGSDGRTSGDSNGNEAREPDDMLHLPLALAVPEGLQLKKGQRQGQGQGRGNRASPPYIPFAMHFGKLMRKLFLLCACMLLIQPSAAVTYDQSAVSTPDTHTYTIPAGVAEVKITARGAKGGDAYGSSTTLGGNGGLMEATVPVSAYTSLYVVMGPAPDIRTVAGNINTRLVVAGAGGWGNSNSNKAGGAGRAEGVGGGGKGNYR